jgi:membrane-associated phospholipid phosphatase
MPSCLPPSPPACVAPAPSSAAPRASFPTPLDAVVSDLGAAFDLTNLPFYAVAVAGSATMAFSGADRVIRDAVQEHLGSSTYGNAASLTGYILPAAIAPGVWLTGAAFGDRATAGAGSAAVQALVLSAATTFVLKVSVGREYPSGDAHTFAPFQSWSWPFPAWPSGHTSSATSVVAALTAYYGSEELWIPLVGYPLTFAIALGMLSGDEHWTSDLLTGAVIGQCIGWSVGRAFRARERGEAPPRISLVPLVGPSWQGAAISAAW